MTDAVFLVQQNFTVGDINGNCRLISEAATAANAAAADVVLTPESALVGYPAEDLLYSPLLRQAMADALPALAAALPPRLAVLVGTPLEEEGVLYNGSALLRGGKVEATYKKSHLPNYSVFDEKRYFQPHDNPPLLFEAGGRRYVVQICEEIWHKDRRTQLALGADAILVQNGSPFVRGKHTSRLQTATATAAAADAAVYYVNSVGGQDELVFDGASFALEKDGSLAGQLPAFRAANGTAQEYTDDYPDDIAAVYQALVIGIRDYVRKSRFADGVLLGLSGGIDSALVAVLAADALGSQRVCSVMMPTEYTADISRQDAQALAQNLSIDYLTLPLAAAVSAVDATVSAHLLPRENDVTHENIQSRLRGTLLMALANNRNLLLLATGNKSEFACGYATLYGDMNGGFAPIKDVLKTEVWALARYCNARGAAVIPERIITRAPSAELRPQQTDQDTLPPYEVVDAMIHDHLLHRSPRQMETDYGEAVTRDFFRRLKTSEYKRRQAPPGTKISDCSFGRDWRMPLANGYASYP